MSSYQEPDWAKIPPPEFQSWFLMEIKGGVEVAKHALHTRKCTLLGRAADMVDIPLQHESISRQHARIAFDSQGIPWLRDLQSAHGTTCNKKPLPAPAIGKVETNSHAVGSRGVMLFPGDVLKFGASTRMFCVDGPPEFERGAFQARQIQEKLARQQRPAPEALPQQESSSSAEQNDGESMQEDANEGTVQKTVPMDMDVPPKHRKALERLNAMKYKLANLETEDGRIRRKGDLTEGQEKQLERNVEREKALKESIVALEGQLYDQLHPDSPTSRHLARRQAPGEQAWDDDDDVMEKDDFFDRTKPKDHGSVVGNDESEASLIQKWKGLQRKHFGVEHKANLRAVQDQVQRLTLQYNELKARGEEEETFYAQNDLNLAVETLKKWTQEQELAMSNLQEIERILKVVNSKLKFDRELGYIGEGNAPDIKSKSEEEMISPKALNTMLPPPKRPTNNMDDHHHGSTVEPSMPPPPSIIAKVPSEPTMEAKAQGSSEDMVMPPPTKRKRVLGPMMPPPTATPSQSPPPIDTTITNQSSKVDRPKEPPRGTLAFLSSMTKSHIEAKSSGTPDDGTGEATYPNKATMASVLDMNKDEWRAPAGQDGSGMTKLNAKFAGRY